MSKHPIRPEQNGYGPDRYGRMWDFDYGEVEFLACAMEVGGAYAAGNVENYWRAVDKWFNRMYPERFDDKCLKPPVTHINRGQMGFKIALWKWLGEHGNEQAQKDSKAVTPHVHLDARQGGKIYSLSASKRAAAETSKRFDWDAKS